MATARRLVLDANILVRAVLGRRVKSIITAHGNRAEFFAPEDFSAERERCAQAAVTASTENRATIEQAKGLLMVAYGLNPEQAFAMLRWWSRNRNIKIRDLATRLVELAGAGQIIGADHRGQIDAVLYDLTGQAPDSLVSAMEPA